MERNQIKTISENPEKKSNKKLYEARDILYKEFENTKNLVVELTHHIDAIEEYYNAINDEIKKRLG